MAHSVQHHERPGHLSAKRFEEDDIPPENRLPRLTSATWKYRGGAVGTLTHVIALHGTFKSCDTLYTWCSVLTNYLGLGTTYDTELEVYTDGYHFKLVDPYSTPRLYIRRPGAGESGMWLQPSPEHQSDN